MKILITGGSGLLGQYLNIYLNKDNEILTLYNKSAGNCKDFNCKNIDLTEFEKLSDIFKSFEPDILVHTAAISRPEECERLPLSDVRNVNFYLNEYLTELCNQYKCKFIYTSTDLVYDGSTGILSDENSKPNPISIYAKTKLDSEEFIKNNSEHFLILRTSLLYGIGLNGSTCNFHNMINSFKKGEIVKLFYDQYRTPLSLHNAADIICEISKSDIKNIIMNFGGSERISRSELGELVCTKCKFDLSLIEKTSLSDIESLHKVYDVSMNTELLKSFGLKQMNLEESLDKILSEENLI